VDYKMLVQGAASADAGALLQQAFKQIGGEHHALAR